MPNKRSIGLGQNPQILSLIKYVDYITLNGATISYKIDGIGEYISCLSNNLSLRTEYNSHGLLHIFVSIGVTDYTNDDVINGSVRTIEGSPNMAQLLINNGEIWINRLNIHKQGDSIYVGESRIGAFTNTMQAIALREIGACDVSVNLPSANIIINVKNKQIILEFPDKARKLDIIDWATFINKISSAKARQSILYPINNAVVSQFIEDAYALESSGKSSELFGLISMLEKSIGA